MDMVDAPADLAAGHEELASVVAEAAERLHVPGVAIGIYSNGQEDFVYHGVTSVDNPLDVDSTTLLQIGSITKVYTATAIMILAERGLLSLEDRVRKHVPELRLKDESVAENVTILHLLNHTAGWTGDNLEETGEGDDALERFVASMADFDQLSPLGANASYNNASLDLAGRVIEKITGKTYEAAMRELVLEPLGLDDSFYFPTEVMTRRFVVGHREVEEKPEVTHRWALSRASAPAGGVTSTVADLLHFGRFHLGDGTGKDGIPVLSAETLELMRRPTFDLKGGPLGDSVAISWFLRDVGGVRLAGHGGATNGQQAILEIVPEHNFAVAGLTNADAGYGVNEEVVEWALAHYLGAVEPEPVPLDLSAEELGVYAGSYDAKTAILNVTVDGKNLLINVEFTEKGIAMVKEILGTDPPEQPPLAVRVIPGDRFMVFEGDAKGMKGSIIRDDANQIRALNVGGRLAYRVG